MTLKRPYVIAEIGFNHEGDMDVAKEMIQAAAKAGADAVKFQTFRAVDLALPSAPHYELIKPAEMSFEDLCSLKAWADAEKIDFLSTPFSIQALEWLEKINIPAIKIASMDCTNLHLLKAAAGTGRTIYLSTGMADLDEIKQSLDFLDAQGSGKVVVLHCVSNYPAQAEELNLAALPLLRRTFGRPVGYSDHHHSPLACLTAAMLGAEVVETHFTIYPDREDGDHGHSLGPDQLRQLIADMENALAMLGSEDALNHRPDRDNAPIFRRGLYTAKPLKKGQALEEENLLFCRPVSALGPSDLLRLKGRILCKNLKQYAPITPEDLD